MNIKKMMAALACAATVGFSAQAAEWFNGGIGELWPTNATMKNCEWSDSATNSSWNATEERVDIKLDGATLACEAQSKGVGVNVDSVTFDAVIGFSAYETNSLPAIPESAKAAVTYVATNEDETAGQFYYLAYNDAAGVESNEWKASGVYSDITGGFSAAQGIEVTIAPGEGGFWAVKYVFKGDYPKTFDVAVKKNGSTDYVSTMEFAGNGPGYVTSLAGTYAEKTVAITVDNDSYENVTVTNVMWNGKLYGIDGFRLPEGAENIKVLFEAKEGYKFTGDDFTLIASPIIEDFVINADNVPAPETVESDVTINFFDFGGNELAGAESFKGTPKTSFADSNVVLTAAASFDAQIPGTWWNGQWHAGDFETMIDFPTVFPEETGNEYYMYATNIIYRVGVEGADGVSVTINDDEVTEYTVEDYGLLEAQVTVTADPEEDPLGQGRTFLGWTCEYFGITEPTMKDDLNCTMPENFDAWENLGDIIFVANWEEAPASMFYIGDKGYDSWEEAIDDADSGDTIKVGNDDAVIPGGTTLEKTITIDLAGNKLTIGANCSVEEILKVTDTSDAAGSLDIQSALTVYEALDLGDLVYAQTTGCKGGFDLMESSKVTFPKGVTFPACKTAINNTEVGAQIIVAGTTYTKYMDDWGTQAVAYVNSEDDKYATLDGALADAESGATVKLLADITTDATQQWTITKNITLDFCEHKITKTVANDWVFTIAEGATVEFYGDNAGGIVHKPAALNQVNPATMIQIIGKLSVYGGTYESDFAIFKTGDVGKKASELVIGGGIFTITAEPTYTGPTYAVMNWCTTTINAGTFNGDVVARSYQSQVYPSVITIDGGNFNGKVGFNQYGAADTTAGTIKVKENIKIVPTIIKGVEGNVVVSTTEGNYTVYTLEKAKFDVTFEDGENSTITPAAGTSNLVYGTELTITATADEDYMFKTFGTEWTPNAESNVLTQVVTIKAAATFTAPDAEKAAPEPVPVAPGEPGWVEADSEEEAIEMAEIKATSPDKTVVSDADYNAYFKKVATEIIPGIWKVEAVLKDEIVQAEEPTTDLAAELGDIAAGTVTEVTLTGAKPGLYYSAKYTDDVAGMGSAEEGARYMANADGEVTIDTPVIEDATQMFYQIQVNTSNPD